jgi:hypothetical protein
MAKSLFFACLIFLLLGCGTDRAAKLEKENQELKASIAKNQTGTAYDFQARCAKDARAWFNANWPSDKDTIILDFTNHYHRKMNSCFIEIEYHYKSFIGSGSWVNDLMAYDVYENSKFANFSENHFVFMKPS